MSGWGSSASGSAGTWGASSSANNNDSNKDKNTSSSDTNNAFASGFGGASSSSNNSTNNTNTAAGWGSTTNSTSDDKKKTETSTTAGGSWGTSTTTGTDDKKKEGGAEEKPAATAWGTSSSTTNNNETKPAGETSGFGGSGFGGSGFGGATSSSSDNKQDGNNKGTSSSPSSEKQSNIARHVSRFPLSRSALEQAICEGALSDTLIRAITDNLSNPLKLSLNDVVPLQPLKKELDDAAAAIQQQNQQNQQQNSNNNSNNNNNNQQQVNTNVIQHEQINVPEKWAEKCAELESELWERTEDVLAYISILLTASPGVIGIDTAVKSIQSKLHQNLIDFVSSTSNPAEGSSGATTTAAAGSSSSTSGFGGGGGGFGSAPTTAAPDQSSSNNNADSSNNNNNNNIGLTLTTNIARERCRQQALELLFQLNVILPPTDETLKALLKFLDFAFAGANRVVVTGSGSGLAPSFTTLGGSSSVGAAASFFGALGTDAALQYPGSNNNNNNRSSSGNNRSSSAKNTNFSPSVITLTTIGVFALVAAIAPNLPRPLIGATAASTLSSADSSSSSSKLSSTCISAVNEFCARYRAVRLESEGVVGKKASSATEDAEKKEETGASAGGFGGGFGSSNSGGGGGFGATTTSSTSVANKPNLTHLSPLVRSLLGVVQYATACACIYNESSSSSSSSTNSALDLALEALGGQKLSSPNGVDCLDAWRSILELTPVSSALIRIPRFMFSWAASQLVRSTLNSDKLLFVLKRLADFDLASGRACSQQVNTFLTPQNQRAGGMGAGGSNRRGGGGHTNNNEAFSLFYNQNNNNNNNNNRGSYNNQYQHQQHVKAAAASTFTTEPLEAIPTLLRLLAAMIDELPVEKSLLRDMGEWVIITETAFEQSEHPISPEPPSYFESFFLYNLPRHLRAFLLEVGSPGLLQEDENFDNNNNDQKNNTNNNTNTWTFSFAGGTQSNNRSNTSSPRNSVAPGGSRYNNQSQQQQRTGIFTWSAMTYNLFSATVHCFAAISSRLPKGSYAVVEAIDRISKDIPAFSLYELQRKAFECIGLVSTSHAGAQNNQNNNNNQNNQQQIVNNNNQNNNKNIALDNAHSLISLTLYGNGTERIVSALPFYATPQNFEKEMSSFVASTFNLVRSLLIRAPIQAQIAYELQMTSSVDWLLTALSSSSLVPSSAGALFGALSATMMHTDPNTCLRILTHIGDMKLLGSHQQNNNNNNNRNNNNNNNNNNSSGDSMKHLFQQECKIGVFPLTIGFLEFSLSAVATCPHHPAVPAIARFLSQEVLPGLFTSRSSSHYHDMNAAHQHSSNNSNTADSNNTAIPSTIFKTADRKDDIRIVGALSFFFLARACEVGPSSVSLEDVLSWSRAPQDTLGEAILCISHAANLASDGSPIGMSETLLVRGAILLLLSIARRVNRRQLSSSSGSSSTKHYGSSAAENNGNNNMDSNDNSNHRRQNHQQQQNDPNDCSFVVDARTSENPQFMTILLRLLQTSDILIATATTNLLSEYCGSTACDGARQLMTSQFNSPQEAAGVTAALTRFITIFPKYLQSSTTSGQQESKKSKTTSSVADSPTESKISTSNNFAIAAVTIFPPPSAASIVDRVFSVDDYFYMDASARVDTLRIRTLEMLCTHTPLPFPSVVSLAFNLPVRGVNNDDHPQFMSAGGDEYQQQHRLQQMQQRQRASSALFTSIMDCLGDIERCEKYPDASSMMAKLIYLARRYHVSVPLLQGELRRRDGSDILDSLHQLGNGGSVTDLILPHNYLRYAFLLATLSRDVLTLPCPTISSQGRFNMTYTQEATVRHILRMRGPPRGAGSVPRISDSKMERWYRQIIDGAAVNVNAHLENVLPTATLPLEFLRWAWNSINTLTAFQELPQDIVETLRSANRSGFSFKDGMNTLSEDGTTSNHSSSNANNAAASSSSALAAEENIDRSTLATIFDDDFLNDFDAAVADQKRRNRINASLLYAITGGSDGSVSATMPFQADLFHPKEKFDLGVPHYDLQAVIKVLRARHAHHQQVTGNLSEPAPQEEWSGIVKQFMIHNFIAQEHAAVVTFLHAWSDMAEVLCWRTAFEGDGQKLVTLFESYRTILHLLVNIASSVLTPSEQARAQADVGRALLAFATTIQRVAEKRRASQNKQNNNNNDGASSSSSSPKSELCGLASRIVASTARVLELVRDQPGIRSNVESALLLMLHTFHILDVTVPEMMFQRLSGILVTPLAQEFSDGVGTASKASLSSAVVAANLLRWMFQRPGLASSLVSSAMFPDGLVNEIRLPRGLLIQLVETTCGKSMNSLLQFLFSNRTTDAIERGQFILAAQQQYQQQQQQTQQNFVDRNGNGGDFTNYIQGTGSDALFALAGANADALTSSSAHQNCLPLYVCEAGLGILTAMATCGCSIEVFNSGALDILFKLPVWNRVTESIVGFTALESFRKRASDQQQKSMASRNNGGSAMSLNVPTASQTALFRFEVAQRFLLSTIRLCCSMITDNNFDHATVPVECSVLLKSNPLIFGNILSQSFVTFCEALILGKEFRSRALLATDTFCETTRLLNTLARCNEIQPHVPFLVSHYNLVDLAAVVSDVIVEVLHDSDSSPARRFAVTLFESLHYIVNTIYIASVVSFNNNDNNGNSSQGGQQQQGKILLPGFNNLARDVKSLSFILQNLRTLYPSLTNALESAQNRTERYQKHQQQKNANGVNNTNTNTNTINLDDEEGEDKEDKNVTEETDDTTKDQQQQQTDEEKKKLIIERHQRHQQRSMLLAFENNSQQNHGQLTSGQQVLARNSHALQKADMIIHETLCAFSSIHAAVERQVRKEQDIILGTNNSNSSNALMMSSTAHGFLQQQQHQRNLEISPSYPLLAEIRDIFKMTIATLHASFPTPGRFAAENLRNKNGSTNNNSNSDNDNNDGSSSLSREEKLLKNIFSLENFLRENREKLGAFSDVRRMQNGSACQIPGLLMTIENIVTPAGARRTRAN